MKKLFSCGIKQKTSLYTMIVLTLSFFLVELLVGQFFKSLSLIADSFHMLSDVLSLIIGLVALKIASYNYTNLLSINTFGWVRAEVLGALINSVFLISQCFRIIIDSIDRFISPQTIEHPLIVLYVGIGGLVVNLIGLLIFHGHAHGHHHHHNEKEPFHGHNHHHMHNHLKVETAVSLRDRFNNLMEDDLTKSFSDMNDEKLQESNNTSSSAMNMKGVYLHIIGDTLGSVVVIISALVSNFVKDSRVAYFDPCVSLILVGFLLKSSIPLARESSMILLQRVPTHIQIRELQNKLLSKFAFIVGIHEFHVWQLAGDRIVASVHLIFNSQADYYGACENLKKFFHDEGIHSTTIQPEFMDEINQNQKDLNIDTKCLLPCIQDSCKYRSCCSKNNASNENTTNRPKKQYENSIVT